MFQWDAVDTSPDLGSQNILETFEMATRHTRWTTRTELESFLSLDLFSLTFNNIFLAVLGGGRSDRPHRPAHGSATAAGPVLSLASHSK